MKPFCVAFPAFWFTYIHLLLFFASAWFAPNTCASTLGNETDHLALLKFKESISKDPYGVFNSWNSSTHFCNWDGVTCSPMHQRVTNLDLSGYQLHGTISPHVGNFTFLRLLNLRNNSFNGKIPQELGGLLQMKTLHLSINSLDGEFPINLTNCSQLIHLHLHGNNLTGKIPIEIGSLRKLQLLYIGKNNFVGKIPQSIGNLSYLAYFSAAYNNLGGYIPQEIGLLRNLTFIQVSVNNFYGSCYESMFLIKELNVIKKLMESDYITNTGWGKVGVAPGFLAGQNILWSRHHVLELKRGKYNLSPSWNLWSSYQSCRLGSRLRNGEGVSTPDTLTNLHGFYSPLKLKQI